MPFNKPYRRRGNRKPAYRRRKPVYKRKMAYRKKYDNRLTNRIQPNIAYVKMKYSTTITLDAASGSINSYQFRANSIFDPDFSGSGHQPSLHDLYQGLYQHYEVMSSRIVVRPLPAPETTNAQAGARICQISISTVGDAAEANPGFETIREMKRGPVMFLNDNSQVQGRGSTISKSWNRFKWFGYESSQQTGAEFGFNPAALAFFKIQQSAPAAGFNPIDLLCLVDIYFTVRLTKPITQAQS